MTDEERRLVGTCYKEKGQAEAIKLGHSLVCGPKKQERIKGWQHFLDEHPEARLFCLRGGLRSQISCEWINRNQQPLLGGYKRLRRFLLSWLEEAPLPPLVRIGGLTGSGKTRMLKKLTPYLDLEEYASHRGSAFGLKGTQPSQISFENRIALGLVLNRNADKIYIEDESATLGKLTIPARFFMHLRQAPLIILECDLQERIKNIYEDYVRNQTASFFLDNLFRLEKKLGIKKIRALSEELRIAFESRDHESSHAGWIQTLLHEYYDPLYQKDLRLNQDKVIFKGNEKEVWEFIKIGRF
jgi:tRNA 2-selenouridine synthase